MQFMPNKREYRLSELGAFAPKARAKGELIAGEVGFVVANIKITQDAKVGDTLTDPSRPTDKPFPGFKEIKPMVFSGIFPIDSADYENTRDSLEKLRLNDSAFTYEPETSQALGFGFRCGYLGLLHMEIVQERLEREYNLDLITTAPSVVYKVVKKDGSELTVDNPAKLPGEGEIEKLMEPMLLAHIYVPNEYVGSVLQICQDRRGVQKDIKYIGTKRVQITYEIPLAEVVFDFFDKLKSISRGYASLDYEPLGYQEADLVKLDILINGEPVDALSTIVHRDRAYQRGRVICEKLKEEIPRQMYEVAIQAAIGSRVIARETQKALRKNVLAKCYGGGNSRQRKLLGKEKEGKKQRKGGGAGEIPQEGVPGGLPGGGGRQARGGAGGGGAAVAASRRRPGRRWSAAGGGWTRRSRAAAPGRPGWRRAPAWTPRSTSTSPSPARARRASTPRASAAPSWWRCSCAR